MRCSIVDLMEKSVINAATGERIGNLCDVELDTKSASLCAIIVGLKSKGNSFFAKVQKVRIDWSDIEVIGQDAILINMCGEFEMLKEEKNFLEKLWN